MRMFSNRRGIELSINFIVMLILAIAVFAGGLMFAAKFFGHAESVRTQLDSQTEKQLEKLLDSGSPVVMPINTKEIFRKQHDTFAVGILAKYKGNYEVHVRQTKAVDNERNEITDQLEITNPAIVHELKKNERAKQPILISVPRDVKSGTYMFKVWVTVDGTDVADDARESEDDPYDAPLQMIVKVP